MEAVNVLSENADRYSVGMTLRRFGVSAAMFAAALLLAVMAGGIFTSGVAPVSAQSDEFVSVSVHGYHSCGLRSGGSIACWGYDSYGQASPPQGSFASVSAGFYHTCAVRTDGEVACWGSNDWDDTQGSGRRRRHRVGSHPSAPVAVTPAA